MSFSSDNVLTVNGLRTTLFLRDGAFDVVRNVSFGIRGGEVLALVGESGSGKTITALSLMRLLPDPPARNRHPRAERAQHEGDSR